jgi:hypothetical protein
VASRRRWNGARAGAIVALAVGLLLSTVHPVAAAVAPANDFFAFAKDITLGTTDLGVNTTAATKEAGEPIPSCSAPGASNSSYGNSVWYRFVAPTAATVSAAMLPANLVSNHIYPLLTAYSGPSMDMLTDLGCVFASGANAETRLAFTVTAGTTYYIRAASNSNASSGGIFDFTFEDVRIPTVTVPTAALAEGRRIISGTAPVTFAWTGAAGSSPVDHYVVSRNCEGRGFGGSWTQTAANITLNVKVPGVGCRVRVQAVDKTGRASTTATSALAAPVVYQETSSRIAYRGTWRKASSALFSTGHAEWAGTKGASATLTFTGRSVALVAAQCPKCGTARAYVDGTLVATRSLYARTSSYKRYSWTMNWASSATRHVKIVVAGTAGHPRVYVDLFLALR